MTMHAWCVCVCGCVCVCVCVCGWVGGWVCKLTRLAISSYALRDPQLHGHQVSLSDAW